MNGMSGAAAWLGLVLLGWEIAMAQAPPLAAPQPAVWPVPGVGVDRAPTASIRPAPVPSEVPLEEVPPRLRTQVRHVIERPTLSGVGPSEEFPGKLTVYQWLLDHPDRTARAWRQLGAPCLDITQRCGGRFGWADTHGSDVVWETIYRSPSKHIWYAEGTVRPGPLFPSMPVRAVMVMHHEERADSLGRTMIQHHTDLFVQTDSKAASLAVRLLGSSVPRLTEQCLGQFQMFFSAMANYLHRHPEKGEGLVW
jgi:hypothetical protein